MFESNIERANKEEIEYLKKYKEDPISYRNECIENLIFSIIGVVIGFVIYTKTCDWIFS